MTENEIEKIVFKDITIHAKRIYEKSSEIRNKIKICLNARLDYKTFNKLNSIFNQFINFGRDNNLLDKFSDTQYAQKLNNFHSYILKGLNDIIEEKKLDDKQNISIENIFSVEIENINCSDETLYFLYLSKLSILKEFLEKDEFNITKEQIEKSKNEIYNLYNKIPEIKDNGEQINKLFIALNEKFSKSEIETEETNNFFKQGIKK
ncbi:hypothetical protein QTF06_001507 [Campylobacter jejuni]|nr:hypothetical protein [Campylobacter jejuni]EDP6989439.1 hypothetical protein [Campylobacter jejuni]EHD2525811.1 hypothetical protein [Campylobacter jejuni]EHD2556606.1 hypothetical protein [Campylobacter jejuni]EHD2662646.1 hypothetical protein [Campylobacter jejuni]